MIAQPSSSPMATAGQGGAERFRTLVEFELGGDLRFLAHHDELRLLTRALVRAGWPLAYSQGFNPQPRLRIPLPRNLGVAAASQWALADLSEARTPEELFASLATTLPMDCSLRRVAAPVPWVLPRAERVLYTVELAPGDAEAVRPLVGALMARGEVWVRRDNGPHKGARTVDIRPYIESIALDGDVLRMMLRFSEQRSARPFELLTELGLAAEAYNHRLWRGDVQWNMELTGPTAGPAAPTRN